MLRISNFIKDKKEEMKEVDKLLEKIKVSQKGGINNENIFSGKMKKRLVVLEVMNEITISCI